MPRLKADLRISLKNNSTGETHKIELIRQPASTRKFWVRFDGRRSRKLPEASLTQVCRRLRALLVSMDS